MYTGQADCAHLLLEAGADMKITLASDLTAMKLAISSGNAEFLRVLLDAGVDVNYADADGLTSLRFGSARLRVVQLLCAYGARRGKLSTNAPAECRAWVLETSRWSSKLHHLVFLTAARVR
mmetsp:Transcript_8099/g.19068  ORF Transcript_8099/g.19068 Transcript_8099/m.19068 type:complete len:121 (+) Transcript_8099:177-539(+)